MALNDKDAVLLNIYLAMMDEGKEPFFERCQCTSCLPACRSASTIEHEIDYNEMSAIKGVFGSFPNFKN